MSTAGPNPCDDAWTQSALSTSALQHALQNCTFQTVHDFPKDASTYKTNNTFTHKFSHMAKRYPPRLLVTFPTSLLADWTFPGAWAILDSTTWNSLNDPLPSQINWTDGQNIAPTGYSSVYFM